MNLCSFYELICIQKCFVFLRPIISICCCTKLKHSWIVTGSGLIRTYEALTIINSLKTILQLDGFPSHGIANRIPKHLDKSGFDKVVKSGKLFFPTGNNPFQFAKNL